MKRVLFAIAAAAAVVALAPVALANSLTFNHDNGSITLSSDNVADQGTVTLTDFAFIENTAANKTLTIQGFEFYVGGLSVPGAASDTPGAFLGEENGWTYSIGEGDLKPSSKGTKWEENKNPLVIGDAVQPMDSSDKNYISSFSVINNSGSGYCFTGEVLAAGADCQVELELTANFGGALGSKSDTFIYGFADGKLSGSGANSVSDSQFQAMVENIHVQVAPEPGSLVLFGTGFGLIGLFLYLRHRRSAGHSTIA